MTKMSELLNADQVAALKGLTVPSVTIKACEHTGKRTWTTLPGSTLTVHSECGMPSSKMLTLFRKEYEKALDGVSKVDAVVADVTPEEPARRVLTAADAIEIDPESEAMIQAACTDCDTPILIDPTPIPGHEGEPRVPICNTCARARAKEAVRKQRAVEVIRRPRVARSRPRLTDGQEHEIVITKKSTPTQENDMPEIDLSNYSPAQLADLVSRAQDRLVVMKEVEVRETAPKAKKVKKAKAKANKQAKAAQRAERKANPLDEIVVSDSLVVPALDLEDLGADEFASAKERSPYNKARFRLLGEPPLDPETTTYGVLAHEHRRLAKAAAEKAAAKAEPKAKKAKASKTEVQIVADLNPKVKALMSVRPDLSRKQAEKILAGL